MDEFSRSVEDGLKLAKRICSSTKEQQKPSHVVMDRSGESFLPTGPMIYAEISDPAMVDNPDIPSYQPYVYGKCDPPALIPLEMKDIEIEAECLLDTVFVTVRGRWWVHCVTRGKDCDCQIVIPMGEQGSILGVEVEIGKRAYNTEIIDSNDERFGTVCKSIGGGFLKPHIFYFTISEINGGANICATIRWSQKVLYEEGQFSIQVPFNFPNYVNPPPKIFTKREKIRLTLNTGTGKEVLLQGSSHPLKEKKRIGEKMSFAYDEAVETWSNKDFNFSYIVHSKDIFGGILLQSPSMNDSNQKDMFCLYLFPPNNKNKKVYKREVVFVIDASLSMQRKPIESVKNSIFKSLLELNEKDYFNIIAFNDEIVWFSSSCLVPATEEMVQSANEWMRTSLVPKGGTNISQPLNQVVEMLGNTKGSFPHIFLVTDGSVEEEREICSNLKNQIKNTGQFSPRISTFGIGSFCNHYFLRKLASIGRGHFDSAYDPDSIETRMRTWFTRASRTILADVTIDAFKSLTNSEFEIYPENIPDILNACITCIFGKYKGKFPDSVKAKGYLCDMSEFEINLPVQTTKDIQLDKVFAKDYIDFLTTQAWLTENKQLENKIIKLSKLNNIPSEYTRLILLETNSEKPDTNKKTKKLKTPSQTLIQTLTLTGFGNVTATKDNVPILFGATAKPPEALEIMFTKAVGCCGGVADCFCCVCCIKACSKLNDQCFIVVSQLCAAVACLGCFECCSQICCNGGDN